MHITFIFGQAGYQKASPNHLHLTAFHTQKKKGREQDGAVSATQKTQQTWCLRTIKPANNVQWHPIPSFWMELEELHKEK